jgi:hypothetical protein
LLQLLTKFDKRGAAVKFLLTKYMRSTILSRRGSQVNRIKKKTQKITDSSDDDDDVDDDDLKQASNLMPRNNLLIGFGFLMFDCT